jgi:hypothetical protein
MEWYKINISYEAAMTQEADDLFISLVKSLHSLSVSLDSLTLYRTELSRENGTSFFLCCSEQKILDKLSRLFRLEKAPMPKLEELEPVYGYFLGEDVAELLGSEISGVRAPASEPGYAEPYRDGQAGYAVKGRTAGNSDPAQQSRGGELGRDLGRQMGAS